MANIEATVRIEEIEGNRLKLSEKHSKKNTNDEWETTGFTDVTAWLPRDYSGPTLEKGQRVKVTGTQRTENREHNGKTYKNLIWSLDSIEVLSSGGQASAPAIARALVEDVEAPF